MVYFLFVSASAPGVILENGDITRRQNLSWQGESQCSNISQMFMQYKHVTITEMEDKSCLSRITMSEELSVYMIWALGVQCVQFVKQADTN